MTRIALLAISFIIAAAPAKSERRFGCAGLVLSVDAEHGSLVVSHDAIPGYMDAMVMPWRVQDRKELNPLHPGDTIRFTLVVAKTSSYLADIRLRPYESVERDPEAARRLKLLNAAMQAGRGGVTTLGPGQSVPDFTLVDQNNRRVSLSQFRGKVVAMTFIYTRCPLPDYCFRLTNNFSQVRQRFQSRLGKDLVLLSVTFDPEHDRPDVLAHYAGVWKANTDGWHFLTGSLAGVKQVCSQFGMNFWPDEGLMTHSLHTVAIGRDGKLISNLEGNRFSAKQLGDLLETAMAHAVESARVK
jgi:protein SCO1/2